MSAATAASASRPALDRRRFEAVKDAVTVPTLAEDLGAKLRRVGDHWRGECVLCGNGANSGAFSAVDRGWHCFACDEGGDVVALAALANDMPPAMAASWIADRFGVQIPERPQAWFGRQARQRPVRDALEEALVRRCQRRLYRWVLAPPIARFEDEGERAEEARIAWEDARLLARLSVAASRGADR
jgi:hypothetical protein